MIMSDATLLRWPPKWTMGFGWRRWMIHGPNRCLRYDGKSWTLLDWANWITTRDFSSSIHWLGVRQVPLYSVMRALAISLSSRRFSSRAHHLHLVSTWRQILTCKQIALLLDLFPALRKLPDSFLPIRRQAKDVGREEHEIFMNEYLDVKKKMSEGKAIVSFRPRS